MSDWKILNKAFKEKEYELMGNIFYKHNSDDLALEFYKQAFNYAKKMAQRAKQEAKDPFNTPYIQQLINEAWNEYEKDCQRIIHKIRNI